MKEGWGCENSFPREAAAIKKNPPAITTFTSYSFCHGELFQFDFTFEETREVGFLTVPAATTAGSVVKPVQGFIGIMWDVYMYFIRASTNVD